MQSRGKKIDRPRIQTESIRLVDVPEWFLWRSEGPGIPVGLFGVPAIQIQEYRKTQTTSSILGYIPVFKPSNQPYFLNPYKNERLAGGLQ